MRVGIIQSSFIPWRGYFDFIASVDLFIFLEDVQYSKNSWRNRNQIKTPHKLQWLTVPVLQRKLDQLISETYIDNSVSWSKKHFGSWQANYAKAPYFDTVVELLSDLNDTQGQSLSELNIKLIKKICSYLDITTPMKLSSELPVSGEKTERLINILKEAKASVYLSGPSADAYLDKEAFRKNGIRLEYKSYNYAPYLQQWGAFEGAVTVLDLIANCGSSAKNYLSSNTPDKIIVP